jgi:hypothetical protein
MAFPLSLSGEIDVLDALDRASNATAAAASIEDAIRAKRPRSIRREGTVVDFKAGMHRFVLSTNILVPITSGHIDVRSEPSGLRICYTIHFTECLVLCCIVTVVFGTAALLQLKDAPLLFRVLCVILPFIWLFGGNVALTMWRFPRLLRRAASVINAG